MPTEKQSEVWNEFAEEWTNDWGPCVQHLLDNTDLHSRQEAMQFLILKYVNSRAINAHRHIEAIKELFPKFQKMFDYVESEMDDEDWK